jgi:glutathione S-transferase
VVAIPVLGRANASGTTRWRSAQLQPSGYLVGDRFSVADLTAAALVFQLVRPREAPHLLPPPLPPAIERFRAEASGRRACKWVKEMYRPHRGRSAEIPG